MKLTNVVIFVLAVVIYAPSRHCGVIFDDPMAIADNPDVIDSSLDRWVQLWKDDFWGREMWSENSHTSYRPLTIISYRIEVLLQGKVDAANMHIVNVLIHAYVSSLVVTVARLILTPANEQAPFIAGVLFAVHPVHVEAVTGLVGRTELLCAGFMLHAYIAMHHGKTLRTLLLVAIACLCKETGITFHGIVFVHVAVGVIRKLHEWDDEARARLRSGIIRMLLSLLHAGIYLGIRAWLIHNTEEEEDDGEQAKLEFGLGSSDLVRKTENPYQALDPGLNKVLSLQVLFVENARLLLFPQALSAEYSFNCIPMVESMFDVRLLFALILWIAGLLSAAAALKGLLLHQDPRLTLALAWLVLPFVPASHVFVMVGTLVAERLLYIPSIGYCFFVAYFLTLPQRKSLRWMQPVFVVLIAWMTMRTSARIPEWETVESLFVSAYETCPQSAKINNQMSQLAIQRGRLDEARAFLDKAREIHPDWCDLDYRYGILAAHERNQEELMNRLIKSLTCIFTSKGAHRMLSNLFRQEQAALQESGQSEARLLYDMGRMHQTLVYFSVALDNFKNAGLHAKANDQRELGLKISQHALDMMSDSMEDKAAAVNREFKLDLDLETYECLFLFIKGWSLETVDPMLAVETHQSAMNCDETKNAAITAAVVVLQYLIQENAGQPKPELFKTFADVLSRVVDPAQLASASDTASPPKKLSEVEKEYVNQAITSYGHYLASSKEPDQEAIHSKINALQKLLVASSE